MLRSLASLVVPPRCGVCARPCAPQRLLCDTCEAALRAARSRRIRLPDGLEVLSAGPYDGVAGRLVAAIKFSGRIPLVERAGAALAGALERSGWAPQAIVPVPPSPARARMRGFDPSALLAAALADRRGIPVRAALVRTDGPRQVGRSRAARIADPPRITVLAPHAGQEALLVDDVLTTGATLGACRRALEDAGVGAVGGLTLAWA